MERTVVVNSTESNVATKKSSEVEKGQSSAKLISQDPKNPFSSTAMTITLVKKKMFSIESLGMASKVIGIDSWLEDTLERKKKRKNESTLAKDTVSLIVHYGPTLTKVKKQKTFSILGQDPEICT